MTEWTSSRSLLHGHGPSCRAAKTTGADAQVTTRWERLIKLAVWVERAVRRIVLHLPMACSWPSTWRQIVRALGATS